MGLLPPHFLLCRHPGAPAPLVVSLFRSELVVGWAPPVRAPGTAQAVFVDVRPPTAAAVATAPDSFVLAKQLPAAGGLHSGWGCAPRSGTTE